LGRTDLTIQQLKLLLPDLPQGATSGHVPVWLGASTWSSACSKWEAVSADLQRQSIPFVLTFGKRKEVQTIL